MNFIGTEPVTPESTPPRLEELNRTVRVRRGRRRVLRAGSVVCIAGLFCVSAFVRRDDNMGILESSDPIRNVEDHVSLAAIESPIEQLESPMQVLAHVVKPEPIFQFDPETQQAWQVGWMETELSIPMDINQFSPAQRARFQNVLFQKDSLLSL